MAKENTEYVGVTYNPQTKEIVGEASAKLNETHQQLKGKLDLNGVALPVNQVASDVRAVPDGSRSRSRFKFKKNGRFKQGKHPMNVTVRTVEGRDVSGITDHGTGFEKRAFRIREKKAKQSKQEIVDDIARRVQRGGE